MLGCMNDEDDEAAARAPVHDLDRALHAWMARFTRGLSPASAIGALADWYFHLALSPGKQQELWLKAVTKGARLLGHALREAPRGGVRCIEPLPQDRRFDAPAWRTWPWNVTHQGFLLTQQWWHVATRGVRGVSRHHEAMVNFGVRQWLDLVSPSNFLWSNPEVQERAAHTFGASLWQGLSNLAEDVQREWARHPPVGTEHFVPGRTVAVTPGQVVFRNHLIELIQYAPQTQRVHAEPLLVVPSWIMKYYILDLSPANSMVAFLVRQGHTVFMVSWRNPDEGDREVGMDDYLRDGVMAALEAVGRIVPGRRVQAMGYCLGGTLLAMAAAAMARDGDERLHTLSLLAAQVDFAEPGELALFIDESQITFLEDLMSSQGVLDGRQMAGAFALLNQRDLVFSRMVRDYLMGERRPVNDLAAWNADATRMPFRQHSHYLRRLYLHNDLAHARYRVGGRAVALSDIRVPIFALGTERDTVSPWHSVYRIHQLTDTEVTFCLTAGGHNAGVVNPPGAGASLRAYRLATRAADQPHVDAALWMARTPVHGGSWWPVWEAWLARHAGPRRRPPTLGRPEAGLPALEDAPGRYVRAA